MLIDELHLTTRTHPNLTMLKSFSNIYLASFRLSDLHVEIVHNYVAILVILKMATIATKII